MQQALRHGFRVGISPASRASYVSVERRINSIVNAAMEFTDTHNFGPWPISGTEVFQLSTHSMAFVNLKPVVPGGGGFVVRQLVQISHECLAQCVGKAIEPHFKAESLTFAIQDGPCAGQTVPHVHIHILPRKQGDFAKNDEVYDAIDAASKHLPKTGGEPLDLDAERRVRTRDEMAAEAAELRALFT